MKAWHSSADRNRLYFWLSFFVLLVIPFRICTYNYSPRDDAKRHVAKVVSGRAWEEVLVLREEFHGQDHNAGWHALLTGVHRLGFDKESLLLSSAIGLFLLLFMSGLFLFRKQPAAWMGAVLLSLLFSSPTRWMLGRPYLVSATAFLLLLALWKTPSAHGLRRWLLSFVLMAGAGWIHGAWYLFALLPIGLVLSGRPREAAQAGAAWITGSLVAGLLTGNPLTFLVLQVRQSLASTESASVTRLLVSEFQPQMNRYALLTGGLALLGIRLLRFPRESYLNHPAFWLAIVGWILGMRNGRFWLDWGSIAFVFWLADMIRAHMDTLPTASRPREASILLLLCGALFWGMTSDQNSRWSNADFVDPLTLDDPAHAGWLPDPGGILYSRSMRTYYDTFFANPEGPWRYILGHEPALMPEEDLEIYRQIQFYRGSGNHLFQPWIEKMTQADRFVLHRTRSSPPTLKELEWNYVAYNTWSGRLPREDRTDNAAPEPPAPDTSPLPSNP